MQQLLNRRSDRLSARAAIASRAGDEKQRRRADHKDPRLADAGAEPVFLGRALEPPARMPASSRSTSTSASSKGAPIRAVITNPIRPATTPIRIMGRQPSASKTSRFERSSKSSQFPESVFRTGSERPSLDGLDHSPDPRD